VLGKRGDNLEKMVRLFENFDRLWAGLPGEPPSFTPLARPPSSSATLESGHGSMQVHAPPAGPASSTDSDSDTGSLEWHPPTPSTALSTESDLGHESASASASASDPDRESKSVDEDAPPASPGSPTESEHSHTLPSSPVLSTESENWYTPPSSPGSDSDSDSDSDSGRWSTISNAPSAGSLVENFQTADNELKGKAADVSRRIAGITRGVPQSKLRE
jgi:hypothetical protein